MSTFMNEEWMNKHFFSFFDIHDWSFPTSRDIKYATFQAT